MKSTDKSYLSVLPIRQAFLEQNDISPDKTTLVQLVYEGSDYCRYRTLTDKDKGDGIVRTATIVADALVVTTPDHALLLPLADCIGAVIHDTQKNILMVSHLGRHNLVQSGGTKCIEYLIKNHGVDPSDLTVWLSPAAGKKHYPLFDFDDRGMHDVATQQLIAAGIRPETITASLIDSAADARYYSHSQFLKGNRDSDGRFAVVALIRP